MLLQPKDIEVTGESGTKKFRISKLPFGAAGREVLTQYFPTGAPFLGSYEKNHDLYLKMMAYVCVVTKDGIEIPLSTQTLIDNHIGGDFAMGVKLETEMLEYNLGFFVQGSLSPFLTRLQAMLPQKILQIVMGLQEQLSAAEKPVSTNSEQSTQ